MNLQIIALGIIDILVLIIFMIIAWRKITRIKTENEELELDTAEAIIMVDVLSKITQTVIQDMSEVEVKNFILNSIKMTLNSHDEIAFDNIKNLDEFYNDFVNVIYDYVTEKEED